MDKDTATEARNPIVEDPESPFNIIKLHKVRNSWEGDSKKKRTKKPKRRSSRPEDTQSTQHCCSVF